MMKMVPIYWSYRVDRQAVSALARLATLVLTLVLVGSWVETAAAQEVCTFSQVTSSPVGKSKRPSMDDPDLGVEPLDEAQRDPLLGAAVRRDPLPVSLHHRGELLVGFQSLHDRKAACHL